MILPDIESLPKSTSGGPETWGEAFGKVVATSDQMMVAVENITASQENFRAAYQSYIDEVEQATGEKLENPMNVSMQRGTFEERPNPQYSMATGAEWIEERGRVAMERFDAQRQALAAKYPAQARLIQLDIDGRARRRMQEAERQSLEALQSPELGPVGRFAGQLIGGLTGSAKDPYQWSMAVIGGGANQARTVAGRIGHVIVTEALINGGQEAVLQAASQERKRQAGLDHGLDDALKNVGIAATFGSLFGSTLQAGAELARIYRLGEGGEAVAARVLDGRPEPGDVETLARAMKIELSPERLDLINRSFEERVLDEVTVPQDGNAAQMRVYEAALRHAEDPDNFPAPDLVERMIAEEEAGRLLTLTPEQYERAYGGDPNAIDDIADTFFADDMSRAAGKIDAAVARVDDGLTALETQRIRPERGAEPLDDLAQTIAEEQAGELATPRRVGPYGPIFQADEFSDWGTSVRELQARQSGEIPGGLSHPDVGPIDVVWGRYDRARPNKGGGLSKIIDKHPEVIERLPEILAGMEVTQRSENRIRLASADHRAVVRLDYDGEAKTWLMTAFEYDRRAGKTTDRPGSHQADGHSSSASSAPENIAVDDGEINLSEVMSEPARDRNGNPENMLDFIGVEDGDGNVRIVSAREALAMADEDNLLADLMEACKL